MDQLPKKYDLAERTSKFGLAVVRFCKALKRDAVSNPIIGQVIRSGTSIGANYMEANNASSRKDFRNKIFMCKKEAQETKYWLLMLAESIGDTGNELDGLTRESQELLMIFQKICSSLDK